MKKLTKFIFASFLALAAVACNKAALEKDQVEAGFASKGTAATITMAENIITDGVTATVTVTVSGLQGPALDSLSLGVLTSLTEDFKDSKFTAIDAETDGTYTVSVPVTPLTKTFFRAAVSSIHCSDFSAIKSVNIPDIPFHLKVAGRYKGTVESEAYGDSYQNILTIIIDDEDPFVCYIGGFDPYYQSKGYDINKGLNYVEAYIDDETETISTAVKSDLNLYGYSIMGVNASSVEAASGYAPVTFKLTKNGLYRKEAFITLTDTGNTDDMYLGDVNYTKQ
ncbi:MAG: hypothetical protein KBS67_05575 [Bacteroidales bacterium]|nr:hypothetical protein [Candidatus Cryptobacteroides equifaecalis]